MALLSIGYSGSNIHELAVRLLASYSLKNTSFLNVSSSYLSSEGTILMTVSKSSFRSLPNVSHLAASIELLKGWPSVDLFHSATKKEVTFSSIFLRFCLLHFYNVLLMLLQRTKERFQVK